jgi:hypothetical protein
MAVGRACATMQILSLAKDGGGRNAPPAPESRPESWKLHTRGGPMFQRTVLAFAILASASTFNAFAETAEERQACTADAQTHCADEIPDRERVYGCLVKKVHMLSAPCKKIISTSISTSKAKH